MLCTHMYSVQHCRQSRTLSCWCLPSIWSTKSQQTDAGWFWGNGKSFRSISLGFVNGQLGSVAADFFGNCSTTWHCSKTDTGLCFIHRLILHVWPMVIGHVFLYAFLILTSVFTQFTRGCLGAVRGREGLGYRQVASLRELIKKEQDQ